MPDLIALIILVISFGGMFFIIVSKWPKLRTAEIIVRGAATHEPLRERLRKKMAGLGPANGFSLEKLLKKALIKTKILFLKGEKWKAELNEAQKHWVFEYETGPSRTDPRGVVFSCLRPRPR